MNIAVYNRQKDVKIRPLSVKKAFTEAARFYNVQFDEAAVHFVSTKEISELHGEFFQDPTPTDCITFPIDNEAVPGYRFLGEICVCPEAALEHCAEHGTDVYEEITLYVMHGLLHLLGYDDMNDKDRVLMRKEEARIMEQLKKENLLIR